jgi:hypothetical protein
VTFRQKSTSLLAFMMFLGITSQARAQNLSSVISGSVRTEDGHPLPDTRIQLLQNGHSESLVTDESGGFSFRFAGPGRYSFTIEHASTPDIGRFSAEIGPGSSFRMAVLRHTFAGDGTGQGSWDISGREIPAVDAWQPARVLTAGQIESLPSTQHLSSLLNQTEPLVVAERFDIAGMTSHRQLLSGLRGSSWSQNKTSLGGLSVSDAAGEGMLLFPDLTAMKAVVLRAGDSPSGQMGSGSHLELLPKTGEGEQHGQIQLLFQCGALQNTNPSDRYRFFRITESDERWRHFLNGGFQTGGALGRLPWHYFGAISMRDIEKRIRNQPLPVSARLGQGTLHFSGSLSARDTFNFYASMHRGHEPQAGASPQITRDASIDQIQTGYTGLGSWTRHFSPQSLLEVRFGSSGQSTGQDFQPGVAGQSQEDMFPGYALAGLPDSPSPWAMLAMLNNTRRGPAPLTISGKAASTEGNAVFTTIREGFARSEHKISVGTRVVWLSSTQTSAAIDGVNLRFFEGEPDSVRMLSAPSRTRDLIRQLQWFAADTFSFSRLSLTIGVSLDSSQGKSLLQSGQSANVLRWTNLAARIGGGYRITNRGPLVLRAGLTQLYDQPLTRTWTAVNPEGIGSRLYSWDDGNGDRIFQAGESGQLLKVSGPPYSRLDRQLRNPGTMETSLGLAAGGSRGVDFQFFGFHRNTRHLITLVNEGVPFSAYTPVNVLDPGSDGEVGTGDDRFITVFNQNKDTLGQDRYLLTNPDGFSAYAQGFELRLGISRSRFQAQISVARFRAVASTAPGIMADQNDTSAYQGVFDDPNKAILARGSTYFDRGTTGRFWALAELPWKMRASAILSYQDGLPFGRYLPVKGLNQGVTGVLTVQRGPGARGSATGPRTKFAATADVRLFREFVLPRGRLAASLDIFNLGNESNALVETPVTAPTQYWRIPLRFETPRSLQLGVRYYW